MINKTIPFVGCTFHVVVQGKDYSGHVLGVVAVLTKDGDAHLIAPQTIRLFDSKQWEALTIEGAKRNSNNIDIWVEYADQVRAALFEDSEVQDALSNPSSQVHSTYKGSELVNLEEMKVVKLSNETKLGARKFLIENLIREDSIASLYGDSGHGKSHIAATLGQSVAIGEPFLGMCTIKGKVLYADWELDREEQTLRAFEVAEGLGLSTPPVGFDYVRVDRSLIDNLTWFQKTIEENDYKLLIIDSFGLACGGDSEASRSVISFLQALRQLRCTVLIVDHQSRLIEGQRYKNKDAFGSIYKKHLSRSAIQVQVIADQGAKKGIVLRHAKANFSARHDDLYAWLEFKEGKTTLSMATDSEMEEAGAAEEMGTRAVIKVALREIDKPTAKAIAEHTELNLGTVRNELTSMKKAEMITEAGKDGNAPFYEFIKEENE